jgi:hypothetical protein
MVASFLWGFHRSAQSAVQVMDAWHSSDCIRSTCSCHTAEAQAAEAGSSTSRGPCWSGSTRLAGAVEARRLRFAHQQTRRRPRVSSNVVSGTASVSLTHLLRVQPVRRRESPH